MSSLFGCHTSQNSDQKNESINGSINPENRHPTTFKLGKETDTELKRIYASCKKTSLSYVDESFPADVHSLRGNNIQNPSTSHQQVREWRRPDRLQSSDSDEDGLPWAVFRDPNSSDICQGSLGNCWFLSALSKLAERPKLLRRLIVTKNVNRKGVYEVRLCKDGDWITVIIDDLFPCDANGMLTHSTAKRKQLWVPIIEKAIAKLYGGYGNLVAGHSIEAFSLLTGFPCHRIKLQNLADNDRERIDDDELWKQLLSAQKSSYLMGASCGRQKYKMESSWYKNLGLVENHSYSLLDVEEVMLNKVDKTNLKLVRLRNPWARFSWNGDWSDRSKKWDNLPEKKKNELDPTHGSEGIFWMAFSDFIRYFKVVEVCKVKENWRTARFHGTFSQNSEDPLPIYKVRIYRKTVLELGLFQGNGRGKNPFTSNTVVDQSILVYKKRKSSDSHPIGDLMGCIKKERKRFVGFNITLKPGKYAILCTSFINYGAKNLQKPPRFVLTIHSGKEVDIVPKTLPNFCIADAIINLAKTEGKVKKEDENYAVYGLSEKWDGIAFVAENRSSERSLMVKLNCQRCTNVRSTRGVQRTEDLIPPQESQVLLVLTSTSNANVLNYEYAAGLQSTELAGKFGTDGAPHKPGIFPEMSALHSPRPNVQ